MKSIILLSFFISLPLKAHTYQLSKKIDIKDSKYEIKIRLEHEKISIIDYLNPTRSFNEPMTICKDGNPGHLSLINFDVKDINTDEKNDKMHNVIFLSYSIQCNNEPLKIKYLALYKGVPYSLYGEAWNVSVNYNWNNHFKIKNKASPNKNLLKQKILFDFMTTTWLSQSILIR